MGVRLNDQTVSSASKFSFTFHVWYRSLILESMTWNLQLSNNSCESNNVTILVGQNILWPFLRIFRGSIPLNVQDLRPRIPSNETLKLICVVSDWISALLPRPNWCSSRSSHTSWSNRVEDCCHIQETHAADTCSLSAANSKSLNTFVTAVSLLWNLR